MGERKKKLEKNTVYYWDSSAIIKRYFLEPGSPAVAELFAQPSALHCTSVITHAEILATIQRIRRDGKLSRTNLQKVQQAFLSDWVRLSVFPYSSSTQNFALTLVQEVSLKGADLIHLATVEEVSLLLGSAQLLTFDQQLMNAAQDRGLKFMEW